MGCIATMTELPEIYTLITLLKWLAIVEPRTAQAELTWVFSYVRDEVTPLVESGFLVRNEHGTKDKPKTHENPLGALSHKLDRWSSQNIFACGPG